MAPHLALVPLTGFRIQEEEMRHWGLTLPGLRDRAAAIAELPALGLLTLAGITPAPWSCSYHPTGSLAAAQQTEALAEQIAQTQPTFVAISALTASIEEAYQLSACLRARGLRTVIGGLHATACPREAAQHFDAVVVGSAETVWPQVLADAERRQLAPRYEVPRATAVPWTLPRIELLGGRAPRYALQTQRGCPLACEFCGASHLLGRFQEKPIELVRHELASITAVAPRPLLELADDNTFAGQRDADPLLDALQASGARWFTESDWRIGERPAVLARLAEAGCRQVLMGIESLVFRYPGQGDKLAELERIMAAVEAIQQAGVVVNGCFIVGADGETRQSMDRLARFILDSPLAEVQLTLQTPFPGSALHRRLAREGRLLGDRGWSHYTLFDVTYRPDRMSAAELEAGFHALLRTVYSAAAAERRAALRRHIWQHARSATL